MASSYIVIGLGLFGSQVARDLFDKGHEVLAMDISENRVEEIASYINHAVICDAKSRQALENLGASQYENAIVCTTSDIADMVLITMNLKALGVKTIICKAKDKSEFEVLRNVGATEVIIPEEIAARELCTRISSENILEYSEISEGYGIEEIVTPEKWLGKTLVELDIRARHNINIIGFKKAGKISSADPSKVLSPEDTLLVFGSDEDLEKLKNLRRAR